MDCSFKENTERILLLLLLCTFLCLSIGCIHLEFHSSGNHYIWSKVTSTTGADLGWVYTSTAMANKLVILKREPFVELKQSINGLTEYTRPYQINATTVWAGFFRLLLGKVFTLLVKNHDTGLVMRI